MRIGVGSREEKLVKGRMFHVKHSPFIRVCRLLMDGMYNNN